MKLFLMVLDIGDTHVSPDRAICKDGAVPSLSSTSVMVLGPAGEKLTTDAAATPKRRKSADMRSRRQMMSIDVLEEAKALLFFICRV